MQYIYKNATVVNQDGMAIRDIAVTNGTITGLGSFSGGEEIDCTGLHILPGIIDSQVHFREPGLEHKEDLQSGSLAAVFGGVTTVFEMPNTDPQTINEPALADKVKRAHHRMHCDFAFWVGGTHDNVRNLAELERLPGAAGIKVFMGSSTGSLLVEDDAGVREILKHINRRAAFHSEDEYRLRERKDLRIEGDPRSHPVWRDEIAALTCTERLVTLAREVNKQIHVLHISTAEEIDYLAKHKDIATCEVTHHHLTMHAPDIYEKIGTLAQMNPPVRELRHKQRLWHGVQSGIIDVLGSDHAPHTLEEKAKPYPASPSGMTGVQSSLPIMLDHISRKRLSLMRFVDLTSHGPARIFNMKNKGRIAVGYDADFTIVDLKKQHTLKNSLVKSKAGWTPYDGMPVTGALVGTVVRGNWVVWEGELIESAKGEAARFM
jgi:dihydroorotase